jgi:hypothetical protein
MTYEAATRLVFSEITYKSEMREQNCLLVCFYSVGQGDELKKRITCHGTNATFFRLVSRK